MISESTNQSLIRENQTQERQDESTKPTVNRSYKGMDMNQLDQQYEHSSRSSQRRNTGNPQKDELPVAKGGAGIYGGARAVLHATQVNASFHDGDLNDGGMNLLDSEIS